MRQMHRPRKVTTDATITATLAAVKESIKKRAPHHAAAIDRVKCYATHTRRGRAYRSRGFLSVPIWSFQTTRHPRYFEHYLAHELAHFVADEHLHTPKFYAVVQELSPAPELELEYRARNAKAAGIREPRE